MDDSAFARIILRLPDPGLYPGIPDRLGATQSVSPACFHTEACFNLDETYAQPSSRFFHIQRFFNILKRCEAGIAADIARAIRRVVTADTRWKVLEYSPGSHVRVALVFEWKTFLKGTWNPRVRLQGLSAMGGGVVQLHPPLYRHHVALTLEGLTELFAAEPSSNPDFMGLELLKSVEARHAGVPDLVAAFMASGGDVQAYAAAPADEYAKPTVASLQAAIDVSRFVTMPLKPYQIATIAWAIDRERHGAVGDCIQLRSTGVHGFEYKYSWRHHHHSREQAPQTRGGFILEEMGMGKTIEMLCVIVAGSHMQEIQARQQRIPREEEARNAPVNKPPKKRRRGNQELDVGLSTGAGADTSTRTRARAIKKATAGTAEADESTESASNPTPTTTFEHTESAIDAAPTTTFESTESTSNPAPIKTVERTESAIDAAPTTTFEHTESTAPTTTLESTIDAAPITTCEHTESTALESTIDAAPTTTLESTIDAARTTTLELAIDAVPEPETTTTTVPANVQSFHRLNFTYTGPRSVISESGGTLIIVPLSLMNQWANEIDTTLHGGTEVLRPMFYHGASRHKIEPAVLKAAPVVITSYETVAADVKWYTSAAKREAAAALTEWRCPGTVYLRLVSGVESGRGRRRPTDLAANDVVLLADSAYRVLAVISATRLHAVPYFSDTDIPDEGGLSPNDLLTAAEQCTPDTLWGVPDVQALSRIGSLRVCRERHDSVLLPTCDTCGTNCMRGTFGLNDFLYGVLAPPLERVRWQRVVLDESHKIQSTCTCLFRSIAKLQSPLKWCMTGTPMPKSVDNLRGQFEFLGVTNAPRPSRASIPWLASSMIRHVKQACLSQGQGQGQGQSAAHALPPITYEDVLLQMPSIERAGYDALRQQTRTWYTMREIESGVGFHQKMYQSILNERRACALIAHALFTARPQKARARAGAAHPSVGLAPEFPAIPSNALNVEDDCPVCLEPIPHAAVLPCRHCFCHECVITMFESESVVKKCPLCKRVLTAAQVAALKQTCRQIEAATQFTARALLLQYEAEQTHSESAVEGEIAGSTATVAVESDAGPLTSATATTATCAVKFDALLAFVRAGDTPTLVFTQFDEVVHTLKALFKQADPALPVNVMTGSTPREGREKAIRDFKGNRNGVLVLSLRTAAVGLNLTHAAQVVFMEPPVSSGLEAQAVGRVHRLGQTKAVKVVHLVVADTIEARMRVFRDVDPLEAARASSRVGQSQASVSFNDSQRRQWRQQWLENLMAT